MKRVVFQLGAIEYLAIQQSGLRRWCGLSRKLQKKPAEIVCATFVDDEIVLEGE